MDDRQLLARYVADRSSADFAELLRRYAPLVYGSKDKRAFLLDFATLQDAHDKSDRNAKPIPQLVSINIDADSTTAVAKEVVQMNHGTSSTSAQFKKIGGSWKINSLRFFY